LNRDASKGEFPIGKTNGRRRFQSAAFEEDLHFNKIMKNKYAHGAHFKRRKRIITHFMFN
jgi:hypothetical protein